MKIGSYKKVAIIHLTRAVASKQHYPVLKKETFRIVQRIFSVERTT